MGKERTLATTGLGGLRRGRACLQQHLRFQPGDDFALHFLEDPRHLAFAPVGQPNGSGSFPIHVARQLP